jgi:hypothetical protein
MASNQVKRFFVIQNVCGIGSKASTSRQTPSAIFNTLPHHQNRRDQGINNVDFVPLYYRNILEVMVIPLSRSKSLLSRLSHLCFRCHEITDSDTSTKVVLP